jgi:hypothetical protein
MDMFSHSFNSIADEGYGGKAPPDAYVQIPKPRHI